MLIVKSKDTTKLDFFGKSNLCGKRPCNDDAFSLQSKDSFKDYVNEIFAGLMWLG